MQEINIGIDWVSPVSKELPAGPDMQYSAEFAELEAAAAVTPEQQYGDVLIPAKAPEWQRVRELAVSLSKQTHDLRVLLLLVRALTRLHGLPGLLKGLQGLKELLQHQWDEVHPQLIVDGTDDPHIRYGVLLEFAAPDGLVGDVRQAVAFHSPLGAFTVRDLERMVEQGSVEMNGVVVNRDKIDDMVHDTRLTTESMALDVPSQLVDLLDQVLRNIEEHSGSDFTPDLTNLKRPLERASSVLSNKPLATTASSPDASAFSSNMFLGKTGIPGQALSSREEVIKAMDAICAYLERHEPTSPVPLLIRRAKRLMTKTFLEIVKDISPDGVNQVRFVAGIEDDG